MDADNVKKIQDSIWRRRLWILWTVYLSYAIFHDIIVSIFIPWGLEIFDIVCLIGIIPGLLMHNTSFILIDFGIRTGCIIVTAFLSAYLHYAYDILDIKGMHWVIYVGLILYFFVGRIYFEAPNDYFILFIHFLLIFFTHDDAIFAEWSNYTALFVGGLVFAILLPLEKFIHFWVFVIAWSLMLIASVICHGVCDVNRPGFSNYM